MKQNFVAVRSHGSSLISDPANSLVVMTSYEPLAYVIPAFPAQTRFVRIQSNFFDPDKTNKMAQEISRTATAHKGPFYLLLCVPTNSRIDDGIVFCGLHKKS